jgi:hypothetical protein
MKLNYIITPENQGGAAVPGCGTISRYEIKPTLSQLSNDLKLPFDLNNYIIGSTGKRDFSGDIDLVIDNKWWDYGVISFREKLEEIFPKENIARNGNMLHLKYPIPEQFYSAECTDPQPRTGYVQIDFNFGDSDWEKFYHFSPGDQSAYKGAHRNLAIAAISAIVGVLESSERDLQNRPIQIIRWIFGSAGFKKVMRSSIKDSRSGDWLKKQQETILIGPYFDPDTIAELLFENEEASAKDLFSLETILMAVNRYCGLVEKEKIYRRMASNFYDWPSGRNFYYPDEISRYFPINDK